MPVLHGSLHKTVEVPAHPTWVGGEAELFKTITPPGYVAKRPKSQESLMRAKLLKKWLPKPQSATFAEDELSETPGGPAVAFLLPFVPGVILFVLCFAVARTRAGITVGFWELRRTARNLAHAVAEIHRAGLIIGDLNLMNVLVAHDDPADPCKVRIIDCESFQFGATDTATGQYHRFRTGVGVPELLPAEHQKRNLRDVDRTVEGDRFALAVIIWQLLFDGAHPFAVRSLSGGPIPPVEECILNGWSNVTPGWPSDPDHETVVTQADFDSLPPSVRTLFIRAFVDGHVAPPKRPTADEWAGAISQWEQSDPRTTLPKAVSPPLVSPALPVALPPTPPTNVAAWVAGLIGAAICILFALLALVGGRTADPKPDSPAEPPAAERFQDAPALWREAAKGVKRRE